MKKTIFGLMIIMTIGMFASCGSCAPVQHDADTVAVDSVDTVMVDTTAVDTVANA